MNEVSLIERAFQLAPESTSLNELRKKLRHEGYGRTYVDVSLSGRLIKTQLTERLMASDKQRRIR